MESPHQTRERPVLFKAIVVLALVFLVSVSLLMIMSPAVADGSPQGRGQDYDVLLVSNEKDPDTGNTIPLSHIIEPGIMTSYKFSVWNLGTFPDDYDLSLSDVPQYWSAVLSQDQLSIKGNTSIQVYLNVTPPYQDVTPGQDAKITIDALSTIDPVNSSSSLITTTTLDVITGFDLGLSITKDHVETDIEDLGNEVILYPGETAAFGVDIHNLANVNDIFDLNATQNGGDWDVMFSNRDDEYSLNVPASTIESDPARLMLQITAPSDASKGDVNYISINLQSKYSKDNGIVPNQITKTITARVDYVSYLLVESDKQSMLLDPNETATAQITVKNIGMLDIQYKTPLNDYVDNGGRWYVKYPSANANLLAPGDTMTFPVEITAPGKALGGLEQDFLITGITDDDAEFLPAKITCEVNKVYDLDVATSPIDVALCPGKCSEVILDVTNTGNTNVSMDILVDSKPNGWSVDFKTTHIFLDPEESMTIAMDIDVPAEMAIGSYVLGLKFYDTREGRDITIYDMPINVMDHPDLVVSSDDINVSNLNPKDGESINIVVTISNKGTLDANDVFVKVVQVTGSGSRPVIHEETIEQIKPGESYQIEISWQAMVSADLIEVEIDPNSEITESDETNNVATIKLYVPNPTNTNPSNGGGSKMGVGQIAAIIGATVLITIAACMVILKVGGKELTSVLGVGSGLFAPLYSKLRHDDVLNNEIREDIYDYILENPGSHFRVILQDLSLSNGTLSHHLNTLEREDFIKSERDGPLRRYYPKGRRLVGEVYDLNDVQKKIMGTVAKNPGITQKELAKAVEVSQPTAHYHLTALRNARLIELRREGKHQKCFIVRRVS